MLLRPYQADAVSQPCKPCSKCGEFRLVTEYALNKQTGSYGAECRPCLRERTRQWRKNNPGYASKKSKEWSAKNPEKKAATHKAWIQKNADTHRVKRAEYYQATKEQRREKKNAYQRQYEKRKREEDCNYALHERISRSVRGCLAGNESKHGRRWQDLVGYTVEELREHLERQFLKGMTWKNRSEWHIDHIIPLASFKITGADCPEFRAAWSLGNLRPLWATENIKKRDKSVFLL